MAVPISIFWQQHLMFGECLWEFSDEQHKQDNPTLSLGFLFDCLWCLEEALSDYTRVIPFKPPLYGFVYYKASPIVGFHMAFQKASLSYHISILPCLSVVLLFPCSPCVAKLLGQPNTEMLDCIYPKPIVWYWPWWKCRYTAWGDAFGEGGWRSCFLIPCSPPEPANHTEESWWKHLVSMGLWWRA